MAHQRSQTIQREQAEGDTLPTVIDLGDAATLTQGSSSQSVEAKQTPYS